jgi:hypothetical protein
MSFGPSKTPARHCLDARNSPAREEEVRRDVEAAIGSAQEEQPTLAIVAGGCTPVRVQREMTAGAHFTSDDGASL